MDNVEQRARELSWIDTVKASGKTAITRNHVSAPIRMLWNYGLIQGKVLDYGCGKSYKITSKLITLDGWDPIHRPNGIKAQDYDTVIMIYVLNTIPQQHRFRVIENARLLMKYTGSLYIAVRDDIKKAIETKRGTFQFPITLQEMSSYRANFKPLLTRRGSWKMYHLGASS